MSVSSVLSNLAKLSSAEELHRASGRETWSHVAVIPRGGAADLRDFLDSAISEMEAKGYRLVSASHSWVDRGGNQGFDLTALTVWEFVPL